MPISLNLTQEKPGVNEGCRQYKTRKKPFLYAVTLAYNMEGRVAKSA